MPKGLEEWDLSSEDGNEFNLYFSSNVIRVIKSKKIKLPEHMKSKRCKYLLKNLESGDNSGDLNVDGRIILKWIIGK
jgi:hypothetical protein